MSVAWLQCLSKTSCYMGAPSENGCRGQRAESALAFRGVNQEDLHRILWVGWQGKKMIVTAWDSKRGLQMPSVDYGTASLSHSGKRKPKWSALLNQRSPVLLTNQSRAWHIFRPYDALRFCFGGRSDLTCSFVIFSPLLASDYLYILDWHAQLHLFHSVLQRCFLYRSETACYELDPQICALPHLFIPLSVLEVLYRSCSLVTVPLVRWMGEEGNQSKAVLFSQCGGVIT